MVATSIQKSKYKICPVCNRGKLIFENKDSNNTKIRLVRPDNNEKVHWFIKCSVCKEQIGIVFE